MSRPVEGTAYTYYGPYEVFTGYATGNLYLVAGDTYVVTQAHTDTLVTIRHYGSVVPWPFMVKWEHLDPDPKGPEFLEDQQ